MKLSANKKGQIYDEINRQMYVLRQHLNKHESLPMNYITQKICELEASLARSVIEIVEGKKTS